MKRRIDKAIQERKPNSAVPCKKTKELKELNEYGREREEWKREKEGKKRRKKEGGLNAKISAGEEGKKSGSGKTSRRAGRGCNAVLPVGL